MIQSLYRINFFVKIEKDIDLILLVLNQFIPELIIDLIIDLNHFISDKPCKSPKYMTEPITISTQSILIVELNLFVVDSLDAL